MSRRRDQRRDRLERRRRQHGAEPDSGAGGRRAGEWIARGGDPRDVSRDDFESLQHQVGNRAAGELAGRSQALPADEGRPLPASTRAEMESLLGEPLDDVRVHDDAAGAAVADRHAAEAVTIGDDISFASGRFRPGTVDGDALIAHEVAHTVQQRGAAPARAAAFRDDRSGERGEEREADGAAAALFRRRLTGVGGRFRISRHRARAAIRRAAICRSEPSLADVQHAVERAEQITSVGAVATSNPEVRTRLEGANQRIGRLKSHVDTVVNLEHRAEDAWDIIDSLSALDRLQNDDGSWVDQPAAAREFGRLFAATGRLMAATDIPLFAQYGEWLAGAGDFFTNMYRQVNVDAIYEDRARRQGPEVERYLRF